MNQQLHDVHTVSDAERAILACDTFAPYPRTSRFVYVRHSGVQIEVAQERVRVVRDPNPRVVGLGAAGVLVAGVLFFLIAGQWLGLSSGMIGGAVLVVCVIAGVHAFFGILASESSPIIIEPLSGVLRTKCVTMQLADAVPTVFCCVNGKVEGRPGRTCQIIALRMDSHGQWYRHCVYVGSTIDEVLSRLAPFLGAPVYTRSLDWREVPRKSIEREAHPSHPSYTQSVDLAVAANLADRKIERVQGVCYNCKYPLAGLECPANCPECGALFVRRRLPS